MATLIGIVSKVIGQVFAVTSDGTRRALVEGDRLFAGDQLVTGAEGAVAVHLQNGQELTLGRGSSLQMSPHLLANESPHVGTLEAVTPSEAQLTDVDQLQKAIAAGADPTQTGEATAAGPSFTGPATGVQGGGHSFVMLEEVGGRVDPTIGFPTAGFGNIPQFPEERHNADIQQNADGTPVVVVPPINNPVTLSGLSVVGGELTLNEANLADGSASNPGALTQSGTFSVSAPDGLSSLSIGGINVITGGVAAGFPQSITTQLGNTLTISGYNPATGVVSYSYTLNGNDTHSAGDGANNLSEHFSVVAGDSNGDSTTGSLDVNITDDVPKAVDDSNANTASETLLTLNGNVLTNDVQGADRVTIGENTGPITPGTFAGTYGTLVLNANGTYTYTLHTSDADFKALHGNGNGTETFAYTITDSDGDTSTANLVLQIHNNDAPVIINGLNVEGGELTVFEKNLSTGSAPDSTALTQNGTFTITALDGVTTLTVGGIAVVTNGVAAGFPQTVTTPLGSTLTITGFNATTGVVSYSYTLNHNDAHPTANGANNLPEQFAVTVVDDNGTTANGTLDVNIIDDLPKGVNDSNAGTASETLLTLNGNVLTNDVQGADRVTIGENAGPITPGTFAGTYGTLVLNANGTYTYTLHTSDADFKALHGNGNGTETFAYTITDSDGDTSTANLVLQIHNNDAPVIINGLNVEGGELTVFEKNLSTGSAPDSTALTQNGTFTITALDGVTTLTVGGIAVVTNGVAAGFPQTVTTPLGSTLTITGFNATTGVVSYSYTLNHNDAHPTANGANNLPEQFAVTVVDDNGTTANGTLDVNIIDDLPKGVNDSNAGTASETLLTLNGNVLTNDVQGADRVTIGENTGPITPGTFAGTYGTLVLNANGTYTYTLHTSDADFKALHGNGNGTETFAYTITDSDGDTSTANLVLQIHNNDAPVIINGLNVEGGELTVFEKNLSTGSAPDSTALTQNGTFTITALDGVTTLTVGGIAVVTNGVAAGFPQTVTTPLGSTLTITGFNATTGVVSYSYTLNHNDAHPTANGANNLPEQFAVTVVDDNGTTANGTLDVNIIDDLPKGVNDSNAGTASETLLTLNGNVLSNDVQGADRVTIGENAGPITPGTFAGTYGTLVLNANGTYTYTLHTSDADFKALHGNGNGTETFAYTITDSDGDTSTANLVLQIHNNDDPVIINGLDVNGGELTVYEKNLSTGSAPDSTALTQNGTFTITALDGVTTLTVGGIAVVTNGVAAGFPQTVTTPLGSTLTITGFNATTGVVSYSYTLNHNDAHPTANGANNLPEQFAVTVVDDNGTTANGTLDVNIIDDLPKGVNDSNAGTASETLLTLNGNVLSNDVQGADRVTIGENTGPITPGTFAGTYGTLVLNANGTYTYTLHTSDADFKALHGNGNGTETFAYTITDSDGDTSTANLVLQIHNNDDPVIINGLDVNGGELTVYEKNLSDGSSPNTPALTQNGTFTVTALDGLQTLDVGGLHVVVGGVPAGFPQSIVTPLGSTLTITGFNPTTGVVSYSYTLVDNETHPTGNGANSITENFNVVATDTDGSTATNQINVNIVDDLPAAVASERSVTSVEVDSNLLIVLDISGSMIDPSGVPGLSRLDLAKQAISALLDKYDDLGDVKVQLVTFGTNATDRTSVWVDVATAKSLLAGLTAGGNTNYDAAVATMQTAFNTSGKLTGAQNVGYFFSDGKPTAGQDIGTSDETALKAFLDANGIKNYAIGLGSGVSNANLNPLAYDGSTHTDTNAVVVTDLNQLNSVLSGTVVGAPVTGTLLEGGTFGADGGFIKTIVVDGTTYTYDPKGNSNQGSLSFNGGTNHGTFNTVDNSISIATNNGGTLVVNLDTGEYNYASQKTTSVVITENIGFTVSDNDGDLASSTLTVKVNPNTAPVAVDDHVITNVLSSNIVVPGELLLANDTDADKDPLTASPTSFNTGWAAKGADFIGAVLPKFVGTNDTAANQSLADVRSAFVANTTTMTALLVVSGYLGQVTPNDANDEDLITVKLKAGETLNLDHNLAAGHITMEYSLNGGAFASIADGGTITASADGTYQIHITNIENTSGGHAKGEESYQLTMTVNYAGAHDITPDFHGTYAANDNHGGSDSAAVTISYQDGHTLTGTAGDDVLVAGTGDNIINAGDGNDVLTAGSGNNELHGGAGNDLLFSGIGNDLLDGGTGIDTASYAHATAGVTVNLGLAGAQNTIGAGTDTLTGIENLVGSNFNDTLTGDSNSNVINGGLGNDILNGGGGDDILIGGMGNNTLTGGAGADTFQWLKGNSGHDVVTDFTPGTDKLDLSQLLQGENSTTASLDDYLHFKVVGSGASVLTSIDVSAMAGATPNQTIDLAGVNLASHYGVTPGAGGVVAGGHDTATIINGMLNDHSLKVDTV